MSNSPLVSILIPCYNAVNTVNETVLSVLAQSYTNIEVLINDDFSTDGTYDLLNSEFKKHPLITINQNSRNLGIAGNWNVLFSKAQGKYWLKLDGDDLIKLQFLKEPVSIAETFNTDFTGTSFESLDIYSGEKKTPYIHQYMSSGLLEKPLEKIFVVHPFHLCFTLLKASFVKAMTKHQNFFIDTEVCDAEFQIRAALIPNFTAYFINKPLAYYCFHGNNSSVKPLKQAKSFIYDVVGIHHKVLNEKLGAIYRQKLKKNFSNYLKLMLRRKAPLDLKLLYICLKRAWF